MFDCNSVFFFRICVKLLQSYFIIICSQGLNQHQILAASFLSLFNFIIFCITFSSSNSSFNYIFFVHIPSTWLVSFHLSFFSFLLSLTVFFFFLLFLSLTFPSMDDIFGKLDAVSSWAATHDTEEMRKQKIKNVLSTTWHVHAPTTRPTRTYAT